MPSDEAIPADIQRFIATSIDSVPHLEAVLLLRYNAGAEWDAKMLAQQLYLSEKRSGELLESLCAAGFIVPSKENPLFYQYGPASSGMAEIIDRLSEAYMKHLVEVHNLIHSKINKQAQQFGDAFKWKKE